MRTSTDRLIRTLKDYIDYMLIELDIVSLEEDYPTPAERISFLEGIERSFNTNIQPKLKLGINLYF